MSDPGGDLPSPALTQMMGSLTRCVSILHISGIAAHVINHIRASYSTDPIVMPPAEMGNGRLEGGTIEGSQPDALHPHAPNTPDGIGREMDVAGRLQEKMAHMPDTVGTAGSIDSPEFKLIATSVDHRVPTASSVLSGAAPCFIPSSNPWSIRDMEDIDP